MVDLPQYVKPQKKAGGRVYYYFERYRGTARAWPRVALLEEPPWPQFWVRCRQCERLDATRAAAGAWSWSYRAETGRAYPLPDPKDKGFWAAVDEAEGKEKKRLASDGRTFAALIDEYQAHRAWTENLGASTRALYERYIAAIAAAWGHDPVRDLTTVDAQKAIDSFQSTPRSAAQFRSFLSRLVQFGIPRGYCDHNPVAFTEAVAYDATPYKPWPDWAFELFFEHARIGLHLPVYSAFYTGQRSIDVIPMMRPRSDAKAIELVARKTGKAVFAPVHSEYRAILDATKVEHTRLHLREDGEAWTVAAYRTAWQREMTFAAADDAPVELREKAAAMKRLRDEGLVMHGLRKNAVNALLEVGCTEDEVSSVVEMTPAMVRHYARDVNRRRLALNAMKKLEDGWKDVRSTLFGGAASPILRNRR
jgi:hypothetical protein